MCGQVIITETCDVDYCGVHFVTNDYKPGETSALAIGVDGMIIGHDYEVRQSGIEQLVGKNLCTESSDLNAYYPVVDLKNLLEVR